MIGNRQVVICLCSLLAVSRAITVEQLTPDQAAPSEYSFKYFVRDDRTGDFKTQEEKREGNQVKGSYSVAEPNGDLRTVTYTAGDGAGFRAVVDIRPGGSPMKVNEAKSHSAYYMEMKTPVDKQKYQPPYGYLMEMMKRQQDAEQAGSEQVGTYVNIRDNAYSVGVVKDGETPKKYRNVEEGTKKNGTEEEEVNMEVNKIMKEIPAPPQLHIMDDKIPTFKKDEEESSIDDRITEVARQLAETSLRQEYEDRKLAHIIPIRLFHRIEDKQIPRQESGKSYSYQPKSLPLVARLPVEMAQLQLITEVQTVPHHVYREGFYPVTPAPELSGPLLGGPPLKQVPQPQQEEQQQQEEEVNTLPQVDNTDDKHDKKAEGKSIKFSKGKALPFLFLDGNNQLTRSTQHYNKNHERIMFYMKPDGNGRTTPVLIKVPSVTIN